MKYIARAMEDIARRASRMFPVLLVTGPRQVGKTTLLQRLAEREEAEGKQKRVYVTLDDPDVRYLARHDPGLFLERYTPPVLIDEIQYAPELLPYIKMYVDRTHEKGTIWLIGSQVFRLMKGVSESLAGRVGILNLLGFSDAEIQGTESEPFTVDFKRLAERKQQARPMDLHAVYERIFRGSMPELWADPDMDWELYYRSYVNTYLQRDIRDLAQVADEMDFYHFMTIAAARTARPVVYEEMAKEAGISAPTAKKWLSILVSSHLVKLVEPYHNNILKRVVKRPILHFLDTGLAAFLLGWDSPTTLERGAMSGAFFESFVFSEIYKSYLNRGKEPPLFFYRDKDQKEIDILLYQNGVLSPIEVKKAVSPGLGAIKNFDVLDPVAETKHLEQVGALKTEVGPGCVICMAKDLLPINEKNWYVPVWLI